MPSVSRVPAFVSLLRLPSLPALKNILKRILLTLCLSSEVVSNAIVHLCSPPHFSIPSDPLKQGQQYE
jgi:hypothetical protein